MLDILTACFFTIFIWVGYKNGFLKSAYKVAAFIASIILAYILYPYIKDFIVGNINCDGAAGVHEKHGGNRTDGFK